MDFMNLKMDFMDLEMDFVGLWMDFVDGNIWVVLSIGVLDNMNW